MHPFHTIGRVVGLSIVAGGLTVAPASANSYTDITGTNIWNNTAPILDTGEKQDPELIKNVTRLNQESETAFNACNAAIAQAEQNASPRRFTRLPQTPPPVPEACRRLETLRAEVENLRISLQQKDASRSNRAFRTW